MQILRAGTSDRRGFTLIEVAMVLFIFSILMVAAAPRLASFLSSSKLETNVSRLAIYLEHIRDEAIYKRKVLILRCRIEEG
ncbi:MAG: prepilin-type N-terminal cleavage/methylation domain-containing protein, partial [Deltaproteobacteria bacterium]|nr:prepilin-type N-terminal cleavage/methylation domain-containing protein [Deltaproteobacteria bacterium]